MVLILSLCNFSADNVCNLGSMFLKKVQFRNLGLGYVIKYALSMVIFIFRLKTYKNNLGIKTNN